MTADNRPPAWEDLDPSDRPGEEWKAIPEFEGLYEVSDRGRVRSLDREYTDVRGARRRVSGRVRKQRLKRPDGYLILDLWRDGKQQTRRAHHLVLAAFVGPRAEGMECRHLNGDPSDNRRTNLAWGTPAENDADTIRHGRVSATAGQIFRVTCPRGHALVSPNLVQGDLQRDKRSCQACHRARGRVRFRLRDRNGLCTDIQVQSDLDYQKILAEAGTSHDQLLAESEAWVQNRLGELGLERPEQATGAVEDHGGGSTPSDLYEDAGDTSGSRGDHIREEAA